MFRGLPFWFLIKSFKTFNCVFVINFCVSRSFCVACHFALLNFSKFFLQVLFFQSLFMRLYELMVIKQFFKMLSGIWVCIKLLIFMLSDPVWMKGTFFCYVDVIASKHWGLIKSLNYIFSSLTWWVSIDLGSEGTLSDVLLLFELF